MTRRNLSISLAALAIFLFAATTKAQQMPNPYGAPISLDNAKKAAAAAIAEAQKSGWKMALAIVEPNGTLVYYEKIDNTQIGSAQVAISKARSSALFKRPTKWFEEQLAKGGDGLRYLGLEGAIPLEGGVPIVMDGKIVGAIGMSGGTSAQDAQCAQVGADALKQGARRIRIETCEKAWLRPGCASTRHIRGGPFKPEGNFTFSICLLHRKPGQISGSV
jgi:glc operon protein GlcG